MTPTPSPVPSPAAAASPTAASVSFYQLGSPNNPLILALPPSSPPTSNDVINAGKTLVGLLRQSTGYTIVSVVPPSEADLVAGFGKGNAHIGVLSPFAYLLASNAGTVQAAFARQQGTQIFYGAQFVAHDNVGFTSYFDEVQGANTAQADVALGQFRDKKPCWTDNLSPSGYVVPLGYLNQARVQTRPPAFLAGHVAVVRAIDMTGICDFGATYVDARMYPGLQDQYPDLLRQVDVIWRIPPIIPYESLVFVSGMDEGMRRSLTRAFVDLETTPSGKSAMQLLYGFDAMQVVQDSQYDPFRKIVKASGLDLNTLIK
ncbi:MAG TPA: PhnD/SsuA/transferrin family substrate-binding protein [Anaerolineales bacterium]